MSSITPLDFSGRVAIVTGAGGGLGRLHALALAQRIGWLAEREGHHPELTVAWGRCTVAWWTTRLNGLHENDFLMAAATDDILYSGRELSGS